MPPSRRNLATWRADTRAERPPFAIRPPPAVMRNWVPLSAADLILRGSPEHSPRLPEPQFQRRCNTSLHLQVLRPESRASGSTAEALDRIDGINEEACLSRSSTPSPTRIASKRVEEMWGVDMRGLRVARSPSQHSAIADPEPEDPSDNLVPIKEAEEVDSGRSDNDRSDDEPEDQCEAPVKLRRNFQKPAAKEAKPLMPADEDTSISPVIIHATYLK